MGCIQSSPSGVSNNGGAAPGKVRKKRNQSVYGAEALAFAADGEDETPKKSEMKPDSTIRANMGIAKVRYAYLSKRGLYPDDPDKPNQDSLCISADNFVGVKDHCFMSVFDGHGPDGHSCAWFARDHLHTFLDKFYRQAHAKAVKKCNNGSLTDSNPANWPPVMTPMYYKAAILKSHLRCNEQMHKSNDVKDQLSGTTAVSVGFHHDYLIVSNVGDSRAILGVMDEDGKLKAEGLTNDQTPYRKDERDRVKKAGAMVMSLDQLDGIEPVHENWEDTNGETIDESGDPPRLWAKNGEYPGCAFTRSLGDALAEEIGVFAEPEMKTRKLTDKDKMLIIASDGVFEFLPSQTVVDMCSEHDDPLEACKYVVQTSKDEWLKRETRTDDITMICVFIDELDPDAANGEIQEGAFGLSEEEIAQASGD